MIRAERFSSHEPQETYPVDRKCSKPGCNVTLSRYNSLDSCGVHVTKTKAARVRSWALEAVCGGPAS